MVSPASLAALSEMIVWVSDCSSKRSVEVRSRSLSSVVSVSVVSVRYFLRASLAATASVATLSTRLMSAKRVVGRLLKPIKR